MKLQDFLNEAKQVKAKDPKPKKIKPNKGHESPHPMRGKLVGEAKPQKPKPYSPKQPNPVAKHSRNKSGAGAHKSAKDYDRKDKRADILSRMDEGEERSIIRDAAVEHLVDMMNANTDMMDRETLEQTIYSELSSLDVEDVVDPDMVHGGQRMGDFASGRVIDVVDSGSIIDDVLSRMNIDEGSLVASRGDIINSILEQLRKEAYDDIGLIKHLAKLIGKTVQVRRHKHKKEGGVLQLEMKNEIPFNLCPKCGDSIFHESEGKKDACYHKVKSRYKVWPSAYASGALVQCRKKGAKNWGNKSKKKK
jgi:hypothetical protein